MPLYTKEKDQNGAQAAADFANHALAMLIALLTPLTILVIGLMPWVIRIIFPGFHDEPEKFALAVGYSQSHFPIFF